MNGSNFFASIVRDARPRAREGFGPGQASAGSVGEAPMPSGEGAAGAAAAVPVPQGMVSRQRAGETTASRIAAPTTSAQSRVEGRLAADADRVASLSRGPGILWADSPAPVVARTSLPQARSETPRSIAALDVAATRAPGGTPRAPASAVPERQASSPAHPTLATPAQETDGSQRDEGHQERAERSASESIVARGDGAVHVAKRFSPTAEAPRVPAPVATADARRPVVAAVTARTGGEPPSGREAPRVHIGVVEVVVTAPEARLPAAPSVPPANVASARYLRSL